MSEPRLSLGRLALAVMGVATLILGASTAIVLVLRPGPVVALLVVLAGIAGTIAGMGATAKWVLRRADRAQERTD